MTAGKVGGDQRETAVAGCRWLVGCKDCDEVPRAPFMRSMHRIQGWS